MKASPFAWLGLLLTICFTFATGMELHALRSAKPATTSNSVMEKVLGDARRIFANQFFTMADVYFHSGYYPSIFDRQDAPKTSAMTSGDREHHKNDGHDHEKEGEHETHAAHTNEINTAHEADRAKTNELHAAQSEHEDHDEHDEHEKEFDFLGQPRDWIERFGRNFIPTEHTHLANGKQKEILPWLRMAAEMDPQKIETYTVAAFWLRSELSKPKDAITFLREGQQNNPDSYEILFALGRVYYEDYFDVSRARNLWLSAKKKWELQKPEGKTENIRSYGEIMLNLGRLEDVTGNWQEAIRDYRLAKEISPNPDSVQKQIDKIAAKLAAPKPAP